MNTQKNAKKKLIGRIIREIAFTNSPFFPPTETTNQFHVVNNEIKNYL
jgi:hypothetical protein